jgi:hypothetical protein
LFATKEPIAFQNKMATMYFLEQICSPSFEEAKEIDSHDLPFYFDRLIGSSSLTSVVDDHPHSTTWGNSKHGLFPRDTSSPPPPPSSSSSTKRPRCLSVTFATSVEVFEVPGHSDDDRLAAWLGKEDFRRIRGECHLTLHKFSSGKLKEGSDEFTTRGLEHKTRWRVAARVRQMDRESHHAVFEEQKLQASEIGNSDPDAIALFYADFTNNARAIALILGHTDAEEARKAHQC